MRVLALILIMLVGISALQTQTVEQFQQMDDCFKDIDVLDPCQANDKACQIEKEKGLDCIYYCKISSYFFNVIKKCILKKCSSQNDVIQAIIYQSLQCLSQGALSFALVVLLTILFIIY
ncbi:hypothetical protein ABPG74_019865 [Tetrahymena malaccensis]